MQSDELSGLERDQEVAVVAEPVTPRTPGEGEAIDRLKDENLNLRIDNRAKEIAIAELNRRLVDDRDKFLGAMQDMSYKLGAAETRLTQLEAPKANDNIARQSAPEPATENVEAVIMPAPASSASNTATLHSEPPPPEERRSFFGRLFP